MAPSNYLNAGILLIVPIGTNFSEILVGIHKFSIKEMQLKMSSAKCRPFCLGLNVLTRIFVGNIWFVPYGIINRYNHLRNTTHFWKNLNYYCQNIVLAV